MLRGASSPLAPIIHGIAFTKYLEMLLVKSHIQEQTQQHPLKTKWVFIFLATGMIEVRPLAQQKFLSAFVKVNYFLESLLNHPIKYTIFNIIKKVNVLCKFQWMVPPILLRISHVCSGVCTYTNYITATIIKYKIAQLSTKVKVPYTRFSQC